MATSVYLTRIRFSSRFFSNSRDILIFSASGFVLLYSLIFSIIFVVSGTERASKWTQKYSLKSHLSKMSNVTWGRFLLEWMIVRQPEFLLNKTVESGMLQLEIVAEFLKSILLSLRSSITNTNILSSEKVVSSSHFRPRSVRTVELLDAFPPRCHEAWVDLKSVRKEFEWRFNGA